MICHTRTKCGPFSARGPLETTLSRILGLVAVLLFINIAPTPGATITWTNTNGGFWSTPANWSPHFVPNGSDTAVITASGTYTVTVDETVGVFALTIGGTGQQTLTNSAQNITITNTLTINSGGVVSVGGGGLFGGSTSVSGTLNCSGGVYEQIPVNITAAGTMNIGTGGASLYSPINNSGTVNWNGTITANNNHTTLLGAINNQPAGIIYIRGDVSTFCGCYGSEYFNNAGILRKTAAAGTTTIGISFTNTGTVDDQSGTIQFNAGGNMAGTYNTAAGTLIQFTGGNFAQSGPVTVTGNGVCQQNGATVTLLNRITKFLLISGNVALAPNFDTNGTIQNLQLQGAYLIGTNVVTGTLGISAGGLGTPGSVTVASGGTLNFNGTSATINSPLTNAGTINWSSGTAYLNNANNPLSLNGYLVNQAGGLISIICDQSVGSGQYGYEVIKNLGTIRKTAGLGITTFGVAFTNSGTIDAESGTVRFSYNGNIAGTYNTAAGAIIEFVGGNFVENGAVSVTGSGVCRENGANVTVTNQIPNFALVSGTVNLAPNFEGDGNIHSLQLDGVTLMGNYVVTGTMGMEGSVIPGGGSLTVANGGTLNFNGAGVAIDGPLTNLGTINWTGGGNLGINNSHGSLLGGVFNQPGATINIYSDASVGSGQYGYEFFNNAGAIHKFAGLGITSFGVPFTNSGTIDVQSGAVHFTQGGNLGGTYNTTASTLIEFDGGNFTENAAVTITGAGTCRENGGNVTLLNQITGLTLLSGTVVLLPNFQSDGNIHSLQLDGASFTGNYTVTGTLGMNGSPVAAGSALTIAPGGILNLNGAGMALSGPLTNSGTINWTSPNCNIGINNNSSTLLGAIYNQPSGLINVRNDQGIGNGQYGSEKFVNSGTIRKSLARGTTTVGVPFYNSGTLDIQSGIFDIASQYFPTGGTMNFGITSLGDFGQIAFPTAATLTGTVSANLNAGYFPTIGDSFPVVTYGTQLGVFSNAVLPVPGQWQTNYGNTSFTIIVTNVIAVSAPVMLTPVSYAGGHFTLQLDGPLGPAYSVESSTDLLHWVSLGTNTPGSMPYKVIDSNAGTSRRFYRAVEGP